MYSDPAVANGRVYVGSYEYGNVFCLNAGTGELIWNSTTENRVEPSPAVAEGRIYVNAFNFKTYNTYVYCLRR